MSINKYKKKYINIYMGWALEINKMHMINKSGLLKIIYMKIILQIIKFTIPIMIF